MTNFNTQAAADHIKTLIKNGRLPNNDILFEDVHRALQQWHDGPVRSMHTSHALQAAGFYKHTRLIRVNTWRPTNPD